MQAKSVGEEGNDMQQMPLLPQQNESQARAPEKPRGPASSRGPRAPRQDRPGRPADARHADKEAGEAERQTDGMAKPVDRSPEVSDASQRQRPPRNPADPRPRTSASGPRQVQFQDRAVANRSDRNQTAAEAVSPVAVATPMRSFPS